MQCVRGDRIASSGVTAEAQNVLINVIIIASICNELVLVVRDNLVQTVAKLEISYINMSYI